MERIEQSYEGYVFYNNSNNLNQQHQREKRIIVQPTGDKNTSRAKGMTRRVRSECNKDRIQKSPRCDRDVRLSTRYEPVKNP